MLPVPEPCKSVYQEWRILYILVQILQEVCTRMVKLPDFPSSKLYFLINKFKILFRVVSSFIHSALLISRS